MTYKEMQKIVENELRTKKTTLTRFDPWNYHVAAIGDDFINFYDFDKNKKVIYAETWKKGKDGEDNTFYAKINWELDNGTGKKMFYGFLDIELNCFTVKGKREFN